MIRCAVCHVDNPEGMRFCGGCGTALDVVRPADRRQLTVMFCDLVGSTALADRLDPEDLADLVHAYQEAVSRAILKFEGHVAQHLGDGLLVYFGYPVAHEDDARRAVHASLQMLEAIRDLNVRLAPDRQLAVRIGIHTGAVVTGDVGGSAGRSERLALGSTPNIAARLQAEAEAGAIVISGQTYELLKRAFDVEPLGALSLKGLTEPVQGYRVIARVTASPGVGWAGLVGRDTERRILGQLFDQATQGQLRAALVVGEAGLGKSALVQAAWAERVVTGASLAVGQCSPYDVDTALAPIVTAAESILGLGGLSPLERSARLSARVAASPDPSASDRTLLAELFGLPSSDPASAADLTPQRRKDLTFAALANLIRSESSLRPSLIVIEDLHWADPSTIEFLSFMLGGPSQGRVLFALTARPSFENPWADTLVTRIELGPLSPAEARAIVEHLSRDRTLAPSLLAEVIARTDGVPLYVEELTKTLLESGASDATGGGAAPIPTSLQASLTARLDRLGSARDVAQLASVIGREFGLDMLEATTSWSKSDLLARIDRLVEAELVQPLGPPDLQRFVFRHALIRDAAYDMLLRVSRREQHLRIADALITRFPERAAANPGLVARHLTEAGAGDRAVPYWMRAGRKAASESANIEAIRCFQTALDLVSALTASTARDLQELDILLAMGPSLTMTRGFVVEEVERTYLRAQELNDRAGDPKQRIWIGIGLCQFRLIRGEIDAAHQIGERLVAQAEALGEPAFQARALVVPAITSYYAGRFRDADAWQARARASLAEPDEEFLNLIGLDLDALIGVYAAMTAWHRGHPDLAVAHGQHAIDRARRSGRSNALAHALVFGGIHVHHFRREPEEVLRLASELAALSAEYGLLIWSLMAGLWQLWALSLLEAPPDPGGKDPPSLAIIRAYQSTGSSLALAYFMTLAIETLWRQGHATLAAELADEALAFNTARTDPMWDAEIRRLKGELLASGAAAGTKAETYFAEAIGIARRQGSKALELRASVSLARLLAERGDQENSHRRGLRTLLDSFTEGFDTPDLRDARQLVEAVR